jgi:hypothetical protein
MSQVLDSHPIYEAKVLVTPLSVGKGPVADLVAQVTAEVAARMAVTKRGKDKLMRRRP